MRTSGPTPGRLALAAAGVAIAALSAGFTANAGPAPLAPNDPSGPTPTVGSSFAPTNPVDCTDPNNVINCNSAPIDSPLVVGTAPPGSPFRD